MSGAIEKRSNFLQYERSSSRFPFIRRRAQLVRTSRSRPAACPEPSSDRGAQRAARQAPRRFGRRDRGADRGRREAHAGDHPRDPCSPHAASAARIRGDPGRSAERGAAGRLHRHVDDKPQGGRPGGENCPELDPYGGAFAPEWRRSEPSSPKAPVEGPATFGAARVCSVELALQDLKTAAHELAGGDRPEIPAQSSENVESAPGIGWRQRAGAGLAPDGGSYAQGAFNGIGLASGALLGGGDRPESPQEDIETIRSAPGNGWLGWAAGGSGALPSPLVPYPIRPGRVRTAFWRASANLHPERRLATVAAFEVAVTGERPQRKEL